MNHADVPQQIANGATGIGVGSGVYAFLSQNTDVIALGFTAAMFFVALTFYILNYRLNRKRLRIALESAENGEGERRLSADELAALKALLKKKPSK